MSNPANDFDNFKARLSEQTLKDIEGIDPAEFGFGRKECCGPLPETLPGSMKLGEHIFLTTPMHFNEWDTKTTNVPGYEKLRVTAKKQRPEATFTVAQTVEGVDEGVLRFLADPEQGGAVVATQYAAATSELEALPWDGKGAIATDRSTEYFVFVCSHTARDKRCGFCGAVLMDLLRADLAEHAPRAKTTVLPCSHVGGHIYAGNVIIYSRHGGVGLGRLAPSLLPHVAEMIAKDDGVIPLPLVPHIRGTIGNVRAAEKPRAGGCAHV